MAGGRRGATVGCLDGNCRTWYHFPCARLAAWDGDVRFSCHWLSLCCHRHHGL